jgi:lipoprotein-anchoring transpeptidase ErfK/SrfK
MALWRQSSPNTVKVVLFLSAAAVALGVIFVRQHRRQTPPAAAATSEPPTPTTPAVAAVAAADSGGTVAPPGDVVLTARTPAATDRDAPDTLLGADALVEPLFRRADTAPDGAEFLAAGVPTAVYSVSRGDTLVSIARRFRVTDDLIVTMNHMTNKDRLAVGTPLKVVRGPFRAVVRKSEFRLNLLLDDALVGSMRVGLGANGSTPTGRWVVRDKLPNPGWTDPRTNEYYHPDAPDNPIGEYWIGLEGVAGDAVGKRGFGIHGTIDPGSIGRQMSLGCVRLLPADIETVYRLLVIGDSTVEILD